LPRKSEVQDMQEKRIQGSHQTCHVLPFVYGHIRKGHVWEKLQNPQEKKGQFRGGKGHRGTKILVRPQKERGQKQKERKKARVKKQKKRLNKVGMLRRCLSLERSLEKRGIKKRRQRLRGCKKGGGSRDRA